MLAKQCLWWNTNNGNTCHWIGNESIDYGATTPGLAMYYWTQRFRDLLDDLKEYFKEYHWIRK